jgi:hypothetical protein
MLHALSQPQLAVLAVLEALAITLAILGKPVVRPKRRLGLAPAGACHNTRVSMEATLKRLRASTVWTDAQAFLSSSDPADHWREACWRYLAYPAHFENVPATAVFGVYLGEERSLCSLAVIADADDRMLLQTGAAA